MTIHIDDNDFYSGACLTKPNPEDFICSCDWPLTHSPQLIALRIPGLLRAWENTERRQAAADRMSLHRKAGTIKNKPFTASRNEAVSVGVKKAWANPEHKERMRAIHLARHAKARGESA